jgi:uncharacterized protein YndB with AHSA1/START domain
VEVSIEIEASPEAVFDAWLSPARMASFLCAGNTRVTELEVEPRVGGRFRLVMSDEQGAYDHHGRYLEIDRPHRLRFTWVSRSTEGATTEVTVTFTPIASGTRLVLVHLALPDEEAATRHERGWWSILAKCRAEIESSRARDEL